MNWDDFRLEFDDDGTLNLRGRNGWREPICPLCGEPIRWCLDMFSFTTSPHRLAHAACVWTAEAFEKLALVGGSVVAPEGEK